MTINVLVLCQRYFGTLSFRKEHIKTIEKDIQYLMNMQRINDDEIIITDYLTKGLNHKDDKMTFKMDFDYRNDETIDFIKSHKNYYSYIVIGTCPFYIFNNPNVLLLSYIMKNDGLLIINPSDNPKFKQEWWGETRSTFSKYFDIVALNPKVVMMKISQNDYYNQDDRKYEFKSKKRSSRKSSRKSKKRSSRKSFRKSFRKSSRKSFRKFSRKSKRKSSRKSSRKSKKRSRR